MSTELLRFLVQAPSNIAWAKYMGKSDFKLNLPANPSLSLTLNHLCTFIEVRLCEGIPETVLCDELPNVPPSALGSLSLIDPQLTNAGKERLTQHFDRVYDSMHSEYAHLFNKLNIKKTNPVRIELRTANTFPAASGVASSASAFAAATLAAAAAVSASSANAIELFKTAYAESAAVRTILARLARMGSGSACRSFAGPLVHWQDEDATKITDVNLPELANLVLLVSAAPKAIGSSKAHALVTGSPLWGHRVQRAEERCTRFLQAIHRGDWPTIVHESWREAWEMHSLFHTCETPFSYFSAQTIELLHWLHPLVTPATDESPLVTLDAGPNIHVITPRAQQAQWKMKIQNAFPHLKILEDTQGTGARIL